MQGKVLRMKSIKKNNNSFWMIASFIIILLLFILLLSKAPRRITYDTVEVYNMVALIKALDDDILKEEQYQSVVEKYTPENEDSDSTYGMMKEVLDILDPTGALSVRILDNTSMEKKIPKDEFYNIYENLIDEYGKRDEIALEEVKILGFARNITGNILVTDSESGTCAPELFTEYQGYVTDTYVKRNGQGTQYVAIKDVKDESMEAPYLYVTGVDSAGVHFWINGFEVILPYDNQLVFQNDTICSLTIKEGQITHTESFQKKINDKVLSINDRSVTLESLGNYEFTESMRIYKVFDGLSKGSLADVALGYEFVDFVLKDNKVCACLIVANDEMEYIRVLLKSTGFTSDYHEEVMLTCDSDYTIYKNGKEYKKCTQKEGLSVSVDDLENGDVLKVEPAALSGKITLKSIERNQGIPNYSGIIEVHKKEEGLVIINEVLLEEYLYTVVPSEMPSYYHEQALMAQAVCARTYAYTKMKNAGLKDLGAHLDDSTSFQVYNNIDEQVRTTNAVRQTMGQIATVNDEAMETMYYSTSCGYGSDGIHLNKADATEGELFTNEEFEKYIQDITETDFEAAEAFYRWTYETDFDKEILEKRMEECYNKNKKNILFYSGKNGFDTSEKFKPLGTIKDIFVAERTGGGRAEKLVIQGSGNIAMICGEYYIRYVLLNDANSIQKQDGKTATMSSLLPSAFIMLEAEKKDGIVVSYNVVGGGYGHGNGMSQNGAGAMAKEGYSYQDILMMFYKNCVLKQIY